MAQNDENSTVKYLLTRLDEATNTWGEEVEIGEAAGEALLLLLAMGRRGEHYDCFRAGVLESLQRHGVAIEKFGSTIDKWTNGRPVRRRLARPGTTRLYVERVYA